MRLLKKELITIKMVKGCTKGIYRLINDIDEGKNSKLSKARQWQYKTIGFNQI